MRPALYLILIGLMAYLVWLDDASQRTSSRGKLERSTAQSRTLNERVRLATTAIMPHGSIVYAGDEAGTIRVIHLKDIEKNRSWVAHSGAIRHLERVNERLISIGADGSVAQWVSDGTPHRRDRLVGHHLNAAVVTTAGAVVVAADRGTVARVDVGQRWRMAGIHARAAFSLALSPDQSRVVSGGTDGQLRLWRVSDGDEGQSWRAHTGWVTETAWLSDHIWSAGSDGQVRKWTSKGERLLDLSASATAITSMVLLGETVIAGSESGDVRVFDADTGLERWRHTVKGSVMALGADPHRLYVGQEDGRISIWDMTNGRSIGTLPGD
jgi:WD40 repeat protein